MEWALSLSPERRVIAGSIRQAAASSARRYCVHTALRRGAEEGTLIKQHVLCYGDSLSWGIIPGTRGRHAHDKRWPMVLQGLLGQETRVIEECLNGRTTAWNDPFRPGRCGQELLLPLLQSHSPLDLVVVFLGTNDLQAMYGVGRCVAGRLASAARWLRCAARAPRWRGSPLPPAAAAETASR
jgi:lysophospholipase L1-like esterase